MDAVSPILVDRAREPQGLRQMIMLSLIVHAMGTAGIFLMPAPSATDTTPKNVMTISLGGAPGVRNGGQTQIAGRTTEAAPEEAKPAPAPAATKVPEMVLPTVTTKPVVPRKVTKASADDAHAKAVPKAAQASSGDARVETGARTTGFGLTTGGGGASGYLDTANFCCPDYLSTMIQLIQRNWSARQDVSGTTLMKFTVQRDGRLTDIQMERGSSYFALDQTAQRALLLTRQLPPLPAAFTEPALTVHLNFQYEH